MTRWNTEKMVKLFESPEVIVERDFEPGGDYDTCPVFVKPRNSEDCIFISGFVTGDDPISDINDVDIEMVEVSDGLDSRGGLNSNNPYTIQAYADVRKKLASKGFSVVNKMDDYF